MRRIPGFLPELFGRRLRRQAFTAALVGWVTAGRLMGGATVAAEPARANLWEAAIGRFEQADAANPPSPNGIVFVGSSSIRLWDLPASFPEAPALNRGFGGSHMADCVQFARRIVIKYRPRLVLLYAGDNDLAAGKSPETVRDDFRAFVELVQAELPEVRIVFLSIKPSPARAKLRAAQEQANRLVGEVVAGSEKLAYLDVASCLLDEQGEPRREYYVEDGLHLSPGGYARWAQRVRPLLK